MILTDKNTTKIIVQCDCGRESLEFESMEFSKDEPKEYFISILLDAFYTEQNSLFYKLTNRIKTAWQILRYGTHRMQEICLSEDDVKDLKEVINKW